MTASPRGPDVLAPGETLLDVTILGAGRVVTEYYLPALRATQIASAVTIVDMDQTCLEAAREAHPDARLVRRDHVSFLEALPPDGNIARDLVIVALPNQFHIDACEKALARRRHVLCEKPLSLSAEDCRRIGDLAAVNGDILGVGMVRRYLPSWMLARRIVAGGEIGKVVSVVARDCTTFGWRPRSFAFFAPGAGGVLADMGVHYLDFLDMALGPLTPVSWYDDWRGGSESNCELGMLASDVPVSLVLSRIDPAGAFIRFTGERGELTILKANENQVLLTLKDQPARRVDLPDPFPAGRWPADLRGSFCEMLLDQRRVMLGEPNVAATARDAERACGLIEWAYARRPAASAFAPVAAMDTLVTGGTGFIGAHLVDRLHGEGRRLRCAVRTPATVANLARYPFDLEQVDLIDSSSVRRAMEGIKIVHHLAYGSGTDAAAVTIEGTKNVVEAAIEAGVDCIVVLSTAYVFGLPDCAAQVDETFPYAPYGGEYGQSKSAMEKWCLERAKSSGKTRIVLLNPTNVFGPRGGAYTTLPVMMAKKGGFCWFDGGKGQCNYTFVENVVDAILAAEATPAAHGHRFIVTDGAMSWRDFLGPFVSRIADDYPSYQVDEFLKRARAGSAFSIRDLGNAIVASQAVREVARRSRLIQRIVSIDSFRSIVHPPSAARGPGDWIAGPVRIVQGAPPEWLAELYHTRKTIFSSALAAKLLGWRPRVGWDEARDATLAWLEAAGHFDNHES